MVTGSSKSLAAIIPLMAFRHYKGTECALESIGQYLRRQCVFTQQHKTQSIWLLELRYCSKDIHVKDDVATRDLT